VNEKTTEPSFDPTDDLVEDIDRKSIAPGAVVPLSLLADLAADGTLTATERDAGEMFHRLAMVAMRDGRVPHNIQWRDAAGKWSVLSIAPADARKKIEDARGAIKNENRLQSINAALAAREPTHNPAKVSSLMSAIEDVAKHWWGALSGRTKYASNGVSVVRLANDNDATDERLAKAGNDSRFTAEGARILTDWPFARMHARGQIDADVDVNDILFAAGIRYAQDARAAGMSGVASPDYAKPIVDGGGSDSFAEGRLTRMRRFSAAKEAIGRRYASVVNAVVLDERTLSEVCGMFGGQRDGKVIARERMNEGLRRLAVFYGHMLQDAA
tara:strand:- start:981 stop:1964 length:984 start_codon:yes stop_codon:yes gene_type:complete